MSGFGVSFGFPLGGANKKNTDESSSNDDNIFGVLSVKSQRLSETLKISDSSLSYNELTGI